MTNHHLFCLLGLGIALALSAVHAEETIRLTNGEWPPYLGKKLPGYGIASRIITEAFATQGIKTNYGFFSWNRSLVMAKNGGWDGSAVWLHSQEREKDFYLSDPIIDSSYVFFHLKETPFQWKTIDDLKGLTIGATLGYNYGEVFQKAETNRQITVFREASDEQNLKLLLLKRIQIFPANPEVGLMMLHQNFTPTDAAKLTFHPAPVYSNPLHLLLTRRNPDNLRRMTLFNQGLKKLQESGRIKVILEEARNSQH